MEAHIGHEDTRKASIERRGLSVVSSSGLILGVVVAGAPIFTSAGNTLPAEGLFFATYGALGLITGVVCGIVANAPVEYDVAQGKTLRKLVDEQFWSMPRALGSRRTTEVRVDELLKARMANTKKAWWLRFALLMEAFGIVCLGSAAFVTFVIAAIR